MSGLGTFNGKPRHTYLCQDHKMKDRVTRKMVHITGCGYEFTTCGKPQSCPRCHAPLPTVEK